MSIAGGSNGGTGNEVPIGRGSVRPSREGGSVLVTRPKTLSRKQGKDGQSVQLSANYFNLSKIKNWSLCKHHVDCTPTEDRTYVKKRLLFQHKNSFQGYLFDGSTLFTLRNVCPDGRPREYTSRYTIGRNEDGSEITRDYVLKVRFSGTVEQTDYQHLQIFNLVLRDCMAKMDLKPLRREYYDVKNPISVDEHGLDLYSGFATSFLQCEMHIMLQVELKYKVTRRNSVYDLFRQTFEDTRNRNPRDSFQTAVIGCVVMTTYNNKTYRIDDVDFTEFPRSTFQQTKRGVTTNVRYADYIRERYGKICKDENQPMLISRSNARERRAGLPELVYLIPEFCLFTGLTDAMRKDFRLMKAVNETTCLPPSIRIERLRTFNQNLTGITAVKEKLTSWGLGLERDLIKFTGRILPSETIFVGNERKDSAGRDANWERTLRSNPLLQSIDIVKWVVVVHNRAAREARTFSGLLQNVAGGMKYKIADPQIQEIQRDSPSDFVRGIVDARNNYNPEMVMCIVPNINADRYSAIKRQCILDNPIPSQVIVMKNIVDKKAMSVATKVAIQMNCKLGGAPWAVDTKLKKFMVIGYDVCHDPRDKRRSYGAMVSSRHENCLRWYSNVTHHSAGEELSISFALNAKKCLLAHMESNKGELPNIILIYRDGVGDGSIDHVLNIELKQTKDELEPMYKAVGKTLKVAFVIVTKRISTRIFMGTNNPPPGTIVDDCITSPYKYDFFLISQIVRQGTASPTHYNVIEDTTGLTANQIQVLTYKFTHLYYNWTGTVRVPAPCQYAHKLAFLTAQSVFQTHSNLDRLLYYL